VRGIVRSDALFHALFSKWNLSQNIMCLEGCESTICSIIFAAGKGIHHPERRALMEARM